MTDNLEDEHAEEPMPSRRRKHAPCRIDLERTRTGRRPVARRGWWERALVPAGHF